MVGGAGVFRMEKSRLNEGPNCYSKYIKGIIWKRDETYSVLPWRTVLGFGLDVGQERNN